MATGVRRTVAGTPEIVHLKSKVFVARAARTTYAGDPKLVLPDGANFKLPQVAPAIDSPFIAARPEVILLNEPFTKEINPGTFSSIKAIHGLHSNEVSSLCQDYAGNLWIGAWWGGVSKYDGRSLTNYSVAQGLSSDDVNCVLADTRGNLWFGTMENGVNKFDGKSITQYSINQGLGGNFVWDMIEDKDRNIWFASGNVVSRYDGLSFTHYTAAQGLHEKGLLSLFEDSKGNLWAGGTGGLARFNGRSFIQHTTNIALNDSAEVTSIKEDKAGNLWFTTNNEGLFKYDGQYVTQYTTQGGLSSNRLTKIARDANGDLWIGTWGDGVNRYDETSFTHYGVEEGLGNETVTDIFQDKSGNLWLATTSGLTKFDGKCFSHITPFRQGEVESLLADSHSNIWIGSGAGPSLNRYDGKCKYRYTTAQGLTNTNINQILEDKKGNIWFGSRGGADKYDGRHFTNYSTTNGLIDNTVFCLLEDKAGNIWFGTQNGLSKFDGKSFTNYATEQGLTDQTVYSLLQDRKGNIWIGTSKNGVYTFDGSSFTHYDMSSSLSHPMVLGMMEDRNNNIWFCTGLGVNKFDGKAFTWYTIEQGLTHNIVKNVLEDKHGNIWIGTINGLNRLSPEKATSYDTSNQSFRPLFKKYTITEGFLGGGTYENSITQDLQGKLWIGATDRVALYHPEGDIDDTVPPTLQLSSISLFNEEINWIDVEKKKEKSVTLNNGSKLKNLSFTTLSPWNNQPENLRLNYDNNHITFHFVGIKTYRPREVRYQYFLEGFDAHWSAIHEKPEAAYSNLPHGKYTLKVRAVSSEGHWSNELKYSFVILPPWWSTWWAYIVYGCVSIMAVWIFTWYRSRRLKTENLLLERNVQQRTKELEQSINEKYRLMKTIESQEALSRERLRISRELHDDIGSTLGSISIYSEVAKKHAAKKENATDVLSKIGDASRELINKMNDIVWTLNPNNDSFLQLHNRMIAFTAMILSAENIQHCFLVQPEVKNVRFTSEKRKNIFLIYKESLHNIVKHADSKNVWINLSILGDNFRMTIKDDGKGFDEQRLSKLATNIRPDYLGGNGIINMKARANDLNGTLSISSTTNQGTILELTLPL